MQFKRFALLVGFLLATTGSAQAQPRDRVLIPAPIPDYGAVAVPAGMPVPDGFTYYLRADLGWAFANSISYRETGAEFGGVPISFSQLSNRRTSIDDVFIGTVGAGAYFTPRLRGDVTFDFRSQQDVTATGKYTYVDVVPIAGQVTETVHINRFVALANGYWDILPRGHFTPYLGAGIGIVYNDITRQNITTENDGVIVDTVKAGSATKTNVGLAAALMAGAAIAIDQHWALDVSYRALYLEGGSVTVSMSTGENSMVTLGNIWEHQARVGLRYNIW